jgi:hypothetical protein
MYVSCPSDALEAHLAHLKWWDRPETFEFMNDWSSGPWRKLPKDLPEETREEIEILHTITSPDLIVPGLNTAKTIYVERQIVDRLWKFVKDFQTEEPLHPHHLPSIHGWAWLDEPIWTTDFNGQLLASRIVAWFSSNIGVVVHFYADATVKDEIQLQMEEKWGNEAMDFILKVAGQFILGHADLWQWGSTCIGRRTARRNDPRVTHKTDEELRIMNEDQNAQDQFVLSLWEFMQDTLPAVVHPKKSARKRIERATSRPAGEIRVVELRRTAQRPPRTAEGRSKNTEWTHQWRVRSHLRHWTDKTGQQRQTTVHSYVKGPKDRPFIEKDEIYAVRR